MSEWKEIELSQIMQIVKNSFRADKNSDFKYIGLEHIEQESLRLNSFGHSSEVSSNKFFFKKGDILFGKLRPYFRKVIKTKFDGVCSTDIWVIRAKDAVFQDYLFYFLANWEFINIANAGEGGSRMPRADWNFLKNTKWLIPNLEEQKAIAEMLTSLDDKIDLLHKQNKILEQLAETLFHHLFIDNAKDDWEERPLDKIADFLNGLACQKYSPKNEIDKLPVLKIKELRSGFGEDCDWATTDVPIEYCVKNGDIIFSWSGSLLVKIYSGKNCILNQHLFKITSPKYPKWFIYLWTKNHLEKFIEIAESKATTMGHIKRSDLSSSMVLVPSDEELLEMNKTFAPVLERIILNNEQIFKIGTLRDQLLPKLMSGEITLKDSILKNREMTR